MTDSAYDERKDGERSYDFAIQAKRIESLERQLAAQKELTRGQSIRADKCHRAMLDISEASGLDWRDYLDVDDKTEGFT